MPERAVLQAAKPAPTSPFRNASIRRRASSLGEAGNIGGPIVDDRRVVERPLHGVSRGHGLHLELLSPPRGHRLPARRRLPLPVGRLGGHAPLEDGEDGALRIDVEDELGALHGPVHERGDHVEPEAREADG